MIAATGWHGIVFNSPFADMAILFGIHWLSVLLYMDAFVSPFGTGVSFVANTARALFAMEGNRHVPHFLGKINLKYGIPRYAMMVNTVLSMVMVTVFRSWAVLATVSINRNFDCLLNGTRHCCFTTKNGTGSLSSDSAKTTTMDCPHFLCVGLISHLLGNVAHHDSSYLNHFIGSPLLLLLWMAEPLRFNPTGL